MRLPPLALVAALVFLAGCPEDKKESSKDDDKKEKKKEKKSDDQADDDKPKGKDKGKDKDDKAAGKGKDDDKGKDDEAKKPPPKKVVVGGHEIAGAMVPPWAKPTPTGKCRLGKDDDKKLGTLQKGDDDGAGFDDGKGDVDAIVSGMLKTCPGAGAAVSQSLNTGGYTRYMKKDYEKADGWFARALVADPTNTFARYNLACNLALHGKSADALWNLEQLVPAAKAGDPRAVHYIRKASSDSDLNSVKKDPRFLAVTKAYDAIFEAHNCGPDMVWDGGDGCLKVCSAYGMAAGCGVGKACNGARRFGDGLVPYCDDVLKCKDPAQQMFPADSSGFPEPKAKPACFIQCGDGGGECPAGKSCDGIAAVPTMFNSWMAMQVCK